MVHVKAPEEVLPNKKKQVKKKVNASIMQYTTTNHVQNNNIEELEPDIFQNNKGKILKNFTFNTNHLNSRFWM